MHDDRWTWQCERVIPSVAGAGGRLLEEILEQLDKHHWIQRDIFSVHLAMEEALANAIRHGNRFDVNKQVNVACYISPGILRVEIIDEGEGFDPSEIPDPTDPANMIAPDGRGVMLMRHFMSLVEYNDIGNRVIMERVSSKRDE